MRTLNIQFRYRKVGYIFNEVCSAVPKAVIHLTFCQKLILFESWCHFWYIPEPKTHLSLVWKAISKVTKMSFSSPLFEILTWQIFEIFLLILNIVLLWRFSSFKKSTCFPLEGSAQNESKLNCFWKQKKLHFVTVIVSPIMHCTST